MTSSASGSSPAASTEARQSFDGLPFELLESKLRPPHASERSVARMALVDRLDRSNGSPVVIVCAGPGYGKTTALAQWADSGAGPPVAWVSVDQDDNDPVVLLTYVAAALDRVSPIDPDVFEALASPGASIEVRVVPRLGAALAGMDGSVALVLDDLHAVDNPRCIDAIVALSRHLTTGSQLVLSTRDHSMLPLGLLRTRGLSVEIGPDELRMEDEEARALLSAAAVDCSDDELTQLVQHTEGWPAGLYLAALSAKTTAGAAHGVATFTGNDPFVVEFLQSEFLAGLPADELRFLTRTSMLERLSGPLCDAVLATSGSAAMLESLERSNRFVVALDRDRDWYRCHHLVRDLLIGELERSEPDLLPALLGRASDWCAANGREVAAIRLAQAAGDTDRVAATMERCVQAVFASGRTATVEQWFDWLEAHDALRRYPSVAVIGGIFHAVSGRAAASDRWAAAAEEGAYDGPLPDGSAAIDSWRALVRAFRCADGTDAMRRDATFAASSLAPASSWYPPALLLCGLAELVCGSGDAADDRFAEAAQVAAELGAPNVIPVALAERGILALEREEWVQAGTFAEQALAAVRRSRLDDAAFHAVAYAVGARTALRSGRTAGAQELLTSAQRCLAKLTYALPHVAVQTRLELARAYLALADPAEARTMLREIDALLRHRPALGTLVAQTEELRATLSTAGHDTLGVSTLTAAELRVLPLLTTHLSFKEIGQRLFVSHHTVKSHAMSIYRKLDVTSRGAAVERAQEVGLL